jgi:hypothetical protein
MEEMSKDNEQVLLECGAEKKEFDSELTETNERTQELNREFEEDPHLEGTIAELQTDPELMAGEEKLMSHINEDLTTEASPLKDQLKGHNAELVVSTSSFPETDNPRVEELIVENNRLEKKFEELSKSTRELLERNELEMEWLKRDCESLCGMVLDENRVLEEKRSELAKEKEEQGGVIESLQGEIASLRDEKSLLSLRLDMTTEFSRDISENCLQNYWRVLDLENQSLEMHAVLSAVMIAYGEAALQLNKIKKETNTLLNDSHQIRGEKEALNQELMTRISRYNELEEKLLLTREQSASMDEKLTVYFQNQNLDAVTEKNSQHATMAKESRSELTDTVKRMDVHSKPTSRSVNEKPKPNAVSETRKPNQNPKSKGVQEIRKPAPKNVTGKGKPIPTKNRF